MPGLTMICQGVGAGAPRYLQNWSNLRFNPLGPWYLPITVKFGMAILFQAKFSPD